MPGAIDWRWAGNGDWRQLDAEAVALKLVTLDPGNEEAHRCLLRSSAARHDLVEVIERYRSYVVTVDRGDGDASPAMKPPVVSLCRLVSLETGRIWQNGSGGAQRDRTL
jgi:hypothetical protein